MRRRTDGETLCQHRVEMNADRRQPARRRPPKGGEARWANARTRQERRIRLSLRRFGSNPAEFYRFGRFDAVAAPLSPSGSVDARGGLRPSGSILFALGGRRRSLVPPCVLQGRAKPNVFVN